MNATNKSWVLLGQSVSAVTMNLLHCFQQFDSKRHSARKALLQPTPRASVVQLEVRPSPEPIRVARLSGTVIRSGERFALRDVDGCLYPLDSAGRAWQFEGEDVTVTGNLDTTTQMLHILAIESMAA
jgi:hypothetical protein